MGFFQDLKEDLSQAVSELSEDESLLEETDAVEESAETEEMPEEMETESSEVENSEDFVWNEEEGEVPEADNEELDSLLKAVEEAEAEEDTLLESIPEVGMDVRQTLETEMIGVEEKMEDTLGMKSKEVIDETSVITKGMCIKGDIESQGSIEILGTIEGNIDILGKLNVTGVIRGNSQAAEIFADSARITGEIVSEGSVKIGSSSVIIGNITATSAVIAGAVKGDIDVQGPVVLDTSAIVMGNIKSKSVQINNGAVIEGLCSQCYADVNPSNFFEGLK